ncbi:PREDICTED: signal recognition particle 14 kDa protein, partial [Mesitornis unicolor]
ERAPLYPVPWAVEGGQTRWDRGRSGGFRPRFPQSESGARPSSAGGPCPAAAAWARPGVSFPWPSSPQNGESPACGNGTAGARTGPLPGQRATGLHGEGEINVGVGVSSQGQRLFLLQFLTELTRLFQKCRTSGSVFITLKKYDGRTKPVPRKGHVETFEPADNKCLLRATDGKKKISTVVSSKEVNKFQMAYSNLLRANMDGLKKKDKKSKNKKSKATQ